VKMRMRRTIGRGLGLGLFASAALVGINPPAVNAAVTSDQPATDTQVAVFTVDPAESQDQLPAALAAALETAETRADADPSDLAPPYVNRATARVVAPVTSVADVTKVAYAATTIAIDSTTLPDDGTDDSSVSGVADGKEAASVTSAAQQSTSAADAVIVTYYYPSTPVMKYSQTELTSTKGDVLTSDLTGVADMHAAYIDADHNRVVVEASTVTEEMRTALASRYGADKVALFLAPDRDGGEPQNRRYDSSPFWGGAYAITTTGNDTRWHCTIGFPWTYDGDDYYLTAGHCTGLNTHVWMPSYGTTTIGLVVKDSWNNSTGSVHIDGQSYSTGDLALVKVYSAYAMSPLMYVGGPDSYSRRDIGVVASRRPKIGDVYCSGGSTTGELCGWNVNRLRVDIKYSDGRVLRNAYETIKTGTCSAGGDSGGPVYTIRGNGEVAPRGILSGGGTNGHTCFMYFSEIRLAEKALPGGVKHS
jgi:hypothetical protein